MKRILIIASYAPSIVNFRLSLIKDLLNRGYKVSIAVPKYNYTSVIKKKLKNLGLKIFFFSLSRTGLNIFKEYRSYKEIIDIVKNYKPNVVIAYTVKPVIYSGLILKKFPKIKYYPLITGLGFAFIPNGNLKRFFFKYLLVKLYRFAIKHASKVIFQNIDDQKLFYKFKIISKRYSNQVVNGSGVDLNSYPYSPLPKKPIFLMLSRLLIDKGVREYVEAARIVRLSFPNARFQLAGGLDENPSKINYAELKSWVKKGHIEYLGEMVSVQSALRSCKFYVLPSYREGVPRSTLEALSTGRPIITTRAPGCRQTVIHKKNGLLVPIKDTLALANAMISLLKNSDENINKMANESYMLAKNKFEVSKVNKSILNIMNL